MLEYVRAGMLWWLLMVAGVAALVGLGGLCNACVTRLEKLLGVTWAIVLTALVLMPLVCGGIGAVLYLVGC